MTTLASFYASAAQAPAGDQRRYSLGAAYSLQERVRLGWDIATARAAIMSIPQYAVALTTAGLDDDFGLVDTVPTGLSWLDEAKADNPLGLWLMDDTSGTVMTAAVGANNGTYVNTPTLNAALGGAPAVQFASASSQEATIPSSGVAANCAIELFFSWTGGATLFRDNTTTNGWIIGFDNAAVFTVRVGGTTTMATSKSTAQVRDGNMHHLVVSKTGAQCDVYLDNANIATTAAATNTGSSGVWHIARNGSSAGVYTDMTANRVAIYPAALSAARVAAHYNAR